MSDTFGRARRLLLPLALVGLAVLTGAGAGIAPADAGQRKPRQAEGIDVSHWQSFIDWPLVARSGKKFAFVKVTEGTTFLDNRYAINHSRARTAGVVVGGYHYAQPNATPGDAVAEADWFVSNLNLMSGDMRPALDLETANGLDVPTLQQWVRDWLARVHELTGEHATIYVSRAFWRDRVGNTTEAALDGSALWLSKWNVESPETWLPASDWAGYRWSFWQYSGCGSVKGINGCVDLDRFNGTDLTPFLVD